MRQHDYYVYLLTNFTKTVLYVGVTNNLVNRLKQHKNHYKPNSFTSKYNCFFLVHFEHYSYVDNAINSEKEIKGWSRAKKNALIETTNKDWDFLDYLILDESS